MIRLVYLRVTFLTFFPDPLPERGAASRFAVSFLSLAFPPLRLQKSGMVVDKQRSTLVIRTVDQPRSALVAGWSPGSEEQK